MRPEACHRPAPDLVAESDPTVRAQLERPRVRLARTQIAVSPGPLRPEIHIPSIFLGQGLPKPNRSRKNRVAARKAYR